LIDSSRRRPKASRRRSDIATKGGHLLHPDGIEVLALVLVGDELAPLDRVGVVLPGKDVLLADLLGPPAQRGEPVLHRPGGDCLGLPALEQRLDVLGLQARGEHLPEARLLELVREEREHPLPVRAGGEAAVAVAIAQLLELVVQIAHDGLLDEDESRSRRSRLSVGVFVR
jgi:hypothetical protein